MLDRTQTFLLALVLVIAAVVLFIAGLDAPGGIALGAAVGVLAPSGVGTAGRGD